MICRKEEEEASTFIHKVVHILLNEVGLNPASIDSSKAVYLLPLHRVTKLSRPGIARICVADFLFVETRMCSFGNFRYFPVVAGR